ncbi:MAG: hypothetical protein KDK63_02755 [Chlamydiia bacterium]|nr:hypothetical protein [Chlamydiia bacterium]MCB1115652.1 hypothetical protein [Chlamydiia bacterium]
MVDNTQGVSTNSLEQLLEAKEMRQEDSSSDMGTGALYFQMEMKDVTHNMAAASQEVKKQDAENAQQEGFQAPPIPTF